MISSSLAAKLQHLQQVLQAFPRILVAYSGGIDSTLVAKVAYDVLGDNALAVTANSPSLLPNDLEDACDQAQQIGIFHQVVATYELDDPRYASNPHNRCYFCKSELYNTLRLLGQTWQCTIIVDGLNADDLQDYRPGIAAAQERGIYSPLAEVGIGKLEVRQLSQFLGLPWWHKPSQPCLSSRFPYGEAITPEKLTRVGKAESILRHFLRDSLDPSWQGDLRIRSIGDTARIEIPQADLAPFIAKVNLVALTQELRSVGFANISLDLEGFRSGKLNDVLQTSKAQEVC